jgi:hypothetical protein
MNPDEILLRPMYLDVSSYYYIPSKDIILEVDNVNHRRTIHERYSRVFRDHLVENSDVIPPKATKAPPAAWNTKSRTSGVAPGTTISSLFL